MRQPVAMPFITEVQQQPVAAEDVEDTDDEQQEQMLGVAAYLSPRERQLLDLFLTHVNCFLPLVTADILLLPTLRETNGDGLQGGAALEWQRAHARTALIWGCIANGAIMENDPAVLDYSQR